jgi:hypothetical protein
MCLSHLVLAFAKFGEFWKHYHQLVPDAHRAHGKAMLKAIRARKIEDFRNRCVGHIWDNERKRPLAQSEVMNSLSVMASPDFDSFLNWINSPTANAYPSTVVSVVEAIRDAIAAAHGIQPDEVIHR